MILYNYIGKVVVSTYTKTRFVITEITAPEIVARAEKPNENGYYSHYCWETINGDPISNGDLVFEDESLTEPFKRAYSAYCHTKDAYWENYGYYMRRD